MSLPRVSFSDSNGGNESGRQFWLLALLMYCIPEIASKMSGCIPDGWVDCDSIIIIIHLLNISPFLIGLKALVYSS